MKYAVALLAVLAAGCGVAESDAELASTGQGITTQNRIALNRIALNRIALNRIALNRIALNRIALNRLALNLDTASDMLAAPEDRDLLAYTIGCALPSDVTVVATSGDATYEFTGAIGLAPRWTDRRLTTSEQHWVSACLLARVNAHDIPLLISLRGPSPALTVTAAEARQYTLQEGAFYGQVFGAADQPLLAYACMGAAQAAGEPATGELHDRDCTEPDPERPGFTQCGMVDAGPCASFKPATRCDHDDDVGVACEDSSWSGYFEECHTSSSDARGRYPAHSEYDEVITVYLEN